MEYVFFTLLFLSLLCVYFIGVALGQRIERRRQYLNNVESVVVQSNIEHGLRCSLYDIVLSETNQLDEQPYDIANDALLSNENILRRGAKYNKTVIQNFTQSGGKEFSHYE